MTGNLINYSQPLKLLMTGNIADKLSSTIGSARLKKTIANTSYIHVL